MTAGKDAFRPRRADEHRAQRRTCSRQEEERRGHGRRDVEHDADVVSHQLQVIRCVRNQNWRQKETYGCS